MIETLRPILIVGITMLVIMGLSRLIGRRKPLHLDAEQGTIRPERITAWFTVVMRTAMCLSGLAGVLALHMGWIGGALGVMGLAVAGFMAPSLTSLHAVHWNSEGIEGPSTLFGPTLGLKRTQIMWSEIVKAGTTFTSYWFIESGDGRPIYWSYLYKGHVALTQALREHCPNLALPPQMD
ncbi:MAG TPA: hypothetical protein VHT03_04000 [Rhizomicrobium sp.]|jgi:hypothetical protein|nr:hypothetical protein [Rhizomicrobium sp.]